MTAVRTPRTTLIYAGRDITEAIAPYLTSISYTDKLDSDSSDVSINLEDSNRLWQADWFPQTGDEVTATIFYDGDPRVLECGAFEIDDPDFTFGQQGDTLSLGGQATPVSKPLREKRSKEYENVTLRAVAAEVAGRNSLALTGEIVDVTFERLTQDEESDLEFITRISKEYGHLTKVENGQLIFYSWDALNNAPAAFTLTRRDITSFRGRKKLTGTYKSAELIYQKGDDEEEVVATIDADPSNDSEDVLKISTKAEDSKQAELKAREQLRAANADEWKGTILLEGQAGLLAGVNFQLEGFGRFDGTWQIQRATHTASKSRGWGCSLEVHRLRGAG